MIVLQEKIGRGAEGQVYKALYKGKAVAVKSIPFEKRSNDVLFEITLLQKLHHPNIVKMLGYVKEEGRLLIIMELCEAGSLRDKLNKCGKIDDELTLSGIIGQILLGLNYLHEQGIIHRDIKAANVLMTADSICKLSDFGIATDEQHTAALFEGSPYWVAPEVVMLDGASLSSDIWSVGCLAVEIFTGNPPYYYLEPMACLYKLAAAEEYFPYPQQCDTSQEFITFLTNCFQRDPNLRISARRLLSHPFITGKYHLVVSKSSLSATKKQISIAKFREENTLDDYSADYSIPVDDELVLQKPSIQSGPDEFLDDAVNMSEKGNAQSISNMSLESSKSSREPFLDSQNGGYLDLKLLTLWKLEKTSIIDERSVDLLCSVISKLPQFAFHVYEKEIERLLSDHVVPLPSNLLLINNLRNMLDDKTADPDTQFFLATEIAQSKIPYLLLQTMLDTGNGTSLHVLEAAELLLSLSSGPLSVKTALLKSELHFRCLLEVIELHNHTVSFILLKFLKNLVPCAALDSNVEYYNLVKTMCKQLWRTDGKNELEIPSACLQILTPILHLNKERLHHAVDNGIIESLLYLSSKGFKPIKQFLFQLFCEIVGYSVVPKTMIEPVINELVWCMDDVCWRGSIFEATARWYSKEPVFVEKALLMIDFQKIFTKSLKTFENMQDTFLLQFYRISSQSVTLAKHFVKHQVIMLLCHVSSPNPTILIDLLRLFKLFFLVATDLPQTQREAMLVRVQKIRSTVNSVLVQEAAISLVTLITSNS